MAESIPPSPAAASDAAVKFDPTGPIVARAGTYYRVARYIIALGFFVWGVWSIYDGFVSWPKANAEALAKGQKEPHPGYDVPLNQLFGVVLPPAAIGILVWTLYNSRGQYRLAGNILEAPGHPPVPVEAIRRIDKRRWDRKGIAFIEYELADQRRSGRIKLDDFVYERDPTDAILDRIEKQIAALTQ